MNISSRQAGHDCSPTGDESYRTTCQRNHTRRCNGTATTVGCFINMMLLAQGRLPYVMLVIGA